MRVEIVEETEDQAAVPAFPPEENYLDLRGNPERDRGDSRGASILAAPEFPDVR